jgi:hypothetical protein
VPPVGTLSTGRQRRYRKVAFGEADAVLAVSACRIWSDALLPGYYDADRLKGE